MGIINKHDPKPIYLQIANWMREKIYSNEWEVDEKIPSENELMKLLDVSRGTLKKAISVLIEEGLLVQIQGKGTFVASKTISHPLGQGLLSFAESLRQQGLQFETKVIEKRVETASNSVREKLNLPEGAKILYLKRVRYVGKEPIMIMENRINIEICKGIEKVDFEKETLFSQIEKTSNRHIKFARSRYAARVLGKERAKLLDSHEDAPGLHLEQTVYLEGDIPVEWGNVWLKSNKYIVGTILQRH
ncbi:GntR family transcriptional regulator [Caldibacillus debilis]|uniref:GntR family transcriptional regulator n=1 Tax=Caldibacillus debilis TaxID=301148 RepID=UPI002FDA9A03